MPDDIISQVMNSTFLGVPTIFILIAVFVFFVLMWKFKRSGGFKRKSLHKETKKNYISIMNVSGKNGDGKPLEHGLHRMGKIDRWCQLAQSDNLTLKEISEKMVLMKKFPDLKEKIEKELGEKKVYLIQYHLPNLMASSLSLLGLGKRFALAGDDTITFNRNNVVISSDAEPDPPFNTDDIVAFGKTAKLKVLDMGYKLALTGASESLANFPEKMAWLELQTAGLMAKINQTAKLEKEKYQGQLESAEEV